MSRSLVLKGHVSSSGKIRHVLSIRTHDLVGVDYETVSSVSLDEAVALYCTGRFVFGAHDEVMAKAAALKRSGRLVLACDQSEIEKPFVLQVLRDGDIVQICRLAEHVGWDLNSLGVEWSAPVEEWEASLERSKALHRATELRREADELERRYMSVDAKARSLVS